MKRLGRFVIKGLCGFFLIFLILDGGPILLSSSVKEIRQKTENIKENNDLPITKKEDAKPILPENNNDDFLTSISEYNGNPYCIINNNIPTFSEEEKNTQVFEKYSDLDELNRCGIAYANICKELMPTEKRDYIGMVKPSGWHTVKYPEVIPDKYLYNRCHLIAFCLAGENANEKNLITGTRYMNVEGMLPFEEQVAEYVDQTNHHVLYRVTPIYENDNLVASGVQIEAWSVEDQGAGICFNVYCYNVQPGIEIDYKTGDSWIVNSNIESSDDLKQNYVVNTNSKKYHLENCDSVKQIKESNKTIMFTTREALEQQGYNACKNCF